MLTPADLRNPKRASGFNHVSLAGGNSAGGPKPWLAVLSRKSDPKKGTSGAIDRRGPVRATAEEAAQDYCDFANGQPTNHRVLLPTITHKRPKRRPRPAQPQHIAEKRREVRTWDREAAAALPVTNHVYLIAVEGCREAVKIGESWDAHYRAADGQTWHWRPVVVLGFVPTDIPRDADKPVHAMFARHHIANEWFRPAQEVLSYFGVSNAAFFRKTATPRRQAA